MVRSKMGRSGGGGREARTGSEHQLFRCESSLIGLQLLDDLNGLVVRCETVIKLTKQKQKVRAW